MLSTRSTLGSKSGLEICFGIRIYQCCVYELHDIVVVELLAQCMLRTLHVVVLQIIPTATGNMFVTWFKFASGFNYATYESTVGQDDFPRSNEPVIILGKTYSTLYGKTKSIEL